jgi:hypothetical protein
MQQSCPAHQLPQTERDFKAVQTTAATIAITAIILDTCGGLFGKGVRGIKW